jgi:N-acetylglucosaminyl-diphospho-decaprenol L-rhamnosyltransferase
MSYDKITVVINTFNSEDKIQQCLKSIDPSVKVIIIENSNNLNFKNMVEKKYSNVNCFLAGQNLGYAKGNNFGLSKVKSDYALILNPDAFLIKGTLDRLLVIANNFKDFSIIGPARQNEYVKLDLHKNEEDTFEVTTLKGFAMFLNIKQFKEIGFFDEKFFIYLEEIDLCKRLKKKNKKIYLDKKVIINHLGGSSHNEKINFEMELSRNWHWMWSTFYYNKKHYGYFNSLFKVSGKFFSALIKLVFYSLMFNKIKKKIYYQRFSGLFNSIIGRNSWYRPKL